MLELYHNDMSVCAQKVRVALAEKGLEWRGRHLDLRAGDAQKPDYLKLNPAAVVPTLVDGGAVIVESTVINEYIDDAYAEPALRPRDPIERARMRLWTKQLDEGVHAATGVVSACIAFRHQHLKKSPEQIAAYLAKIPNVDRRERTRLAIELGVDSPQFPDAIRRFEKLLGDMEAALADGEWLTGGSYSLADVNYAPYMIRLEHLQLGAMIDRRPKVRAWAERLKERPSWTEGIGKWLNQAYLTLMEEKGREAWPKAKRILGY
ncbi:MAG TPA: glutathione S-transferase family protein [Alphaproteobacteria bacterium]